MAYSATYNIIINAPQATVFDYIADISRHGEWGSADDKMKVAAEKPGPPAVGARYKAEGVLNGKVNQSVVTITAYEPPKRIAFDAEDSNSVFHHEFVFTPGGGGTRVERLVTMTKGPFYFPIVLAIFKSTVVKNYNGAMSNAKAKLEA
ncbi:MAG TPA: SRPBCC family protein [Candidatus Dormibacteraeota bacterium]|nr:SRPBCC family protein [Candidatus Dormibacteraeota bacterium]